MIKLWIISVINLQMNDSQIIIKKVIIKMVIYCDDTSMKKYSENNKKYTYRKTISRFPLKHESKVR